MTVMSGKHAMMEMLRAEGVKYVFGNPGTSESAMMDAIEHYPDLEYVLGDAGGRCGSGWRTRTAVRRESRRSLSCI